MGKRILLLPLLAFGFACAFTGSVGDAAPKKETRKLTVDEAFELSKKTGRPIVAVAGEAA
ncbi:MAG: hypothetical protein DWQ31_07105 [Planctomycetota bacterium]|nr:MAG: hypothetical protein DWQ31_07105 [Planctomycetota bacterium]REJ89562.1 MAG: hypothetical protein DWQ35_17900 [Planctomycetota bacterium]REK31425.1 MAG: hypothetical protein DWQ42_00410 [Planctomycetota bacterium]REK40655.1 MAG: hypothetical protein DWQ46_15550 [Planctomycetota bacterium]